MSDPVVLPPKYYLTYFEYLIGFVRNMYGSLLTDEEIRFAEEYQCLPEDARCLFIRMSNRKGTFFKPDTFNYPEIANLQEALEILIEKGFASGPDPSWGGEITELLNILTKEDLIGIAGELQPVIMPARNIRRPDLIRWLTFEYDTETLISAAIKVHRIVCVRYAREVELFKFLFFGNRYDDMTEFVIRDLGHVRFQTFDDDSMSQRFHTRKEVEDALLVSYLGEAFSEQMTSQPPEELFEWFMQHHTRLKDSISESAKRSLNRLVIKAAGWLERVKLFPQALELYQLTDDPPARERRARILYRLGFVEEAQLLCQDMIAGPQNADELYFGQDFSEKISRSRKKVIRQTTLALNEADIVYLSPDFRYQVELGAAHYYLEQGYQAFFSENVPWRSLFGLLFWDIIYDTNVQAIHHPLQRVPSDFFLPDFYLKRAHLLRSRTSELTTKDIIRSELTARFEQMYGTANVLVGWHEELLNQLLVIVDLLTVDQLYSILLEMATDLRDKTRGFPDLLVWNEQGYHFTEIKSPTDHLSSRQLYWQHYFKTIGVSSRIVRVKWSLPEGN